MTIFDRVRQVNATDLHYEIGGDIWLRCHQQLKKMELAVDELRLYQQELERLITLSLDNSETDVKDFSFSDGVGVIRGHLYIANNRKQLALRFLPQNVPSWQELGLPEVFTRALTWKTGLVIVSGITGSGKTTTLAALLTRLCNTQACHLVTFENPVEYRLKSEKSLIHQIDLLAHQNSFTTMINDVLRMDPDVMMVGELRNEDELISAIQLADTGHLVFATVHAARAIEVIPRIIDMVSVSRKNFIGMQLANILRTVIGQQLLSNKQSDGQILLCEMLEMNSALAKQIREGQIHLLKFQQEQGNQDGILILDQQLAKLVQENKISLDVAFTLADHPERVRYYLQGGYRV